MDKRNLRAKSNSPKNVLKLVFNGLYIMLGGIFDIFEFCKLALVEQFDNILKASNLLLFKNIPKGIFI
jgi:hypothetical protein